MYLGYYHYYYIIYEQDVFNKFELGPEFKLKYGNEYNYNNI